MYLSGVHIDKYRDFGRAMERVIERCECMCACVRACVRACLYLRLSQMTLEISLIDSICSHVSCWSEKSN